MIKPLETVRPITSRKMFGGIGIYCDGTFFAVIDDDKLFFKADDTTWPEYDKFGASQWVIEGNPPQPQPYREVPEAIFADPTLLGLWVDAAVEVAVSKKRKK